MDLGRNLTIITPDFMSTTDFKDRGFPQKSPLGTRPGKKKDGGLFRAKSPGPIQWAKYCTRINYSSCNEDSLSELEALRITPEKKIICITAGGGRVLNLL